MSQTDPQRAQAHASEAERIVAEVQEHLGKRGRKMGEQQANELALANTHATLALYYASSSS